jgi:hypothetical protein
MSSEREERDNSEQHYKKMVGSLEAKVWVHTLN